MRTLVLFTRDLRISDHPALHEACATSEEVVPAFVLDAKLLASSPNRARFLLEGLHDLHRRLEDRSGRLVVRSGDAATEAVELARDAACDRIFVTADVSETALRRERRLEVAARAAGIEVRSFHGNAVVEPGDVLTTTGTPYKVFTPYHRAWETVTRRPVLPEPSRVVVPADVRSDPLPDPRSSAADATDLPRGGETEALRRLETFVHRDLVVYGDVRGDLGADRTSRLSPYLRFGFLSAGDLVSRVAARRGADPFVREVAWRDFFRQLLWSDPSLTTKDLRPGIPVEVPMIDLDDALERWRLGMTGLPLVDAGMRQLLREGWMHNRARMTVASFLTRRLGIPWQDGAAHFMRHLVDGDPANNAGNWQWVAGTGTDAKPVRSFNPVRQAERFDPNGDYIRRYVRELRDVPAPRVFAPWKLEGLLDLTRYPEPLIGVRA